MRFALVFLIACGASKPTSVEPPPPQDAPPKAAAAPSVTTAPPRDDCTRAGANTFAIAKPSLAEQFGDKLEPFGVKFIALMTTRCVEDAWTKEAATCLIAAKVTEDVTKCTNEKLSATQTEKIANGFVEVMKSTM